MEDTQVPLMFFDKCKDLMALHPFTDTELIATLCNVLHGTARDWWDVVRLKIITWTEFENRFQSAFLAEDYQDEVAERIRTRVQGEDERYRILPTGRSLCERWNPKNNRKLLR